MPEDDENITETTTQTTKPKSKKKGVNGVVCILLVLLSLILGGWAGYMYGNNKAEDAAQEQITKLEADLATAKAAISGEVQETQEEIAEGDQTVESLQAENAALKQTISEQDQQIATLEQRVAELEQQLADAQNSDDTPPTTP